MQAKLWRRCENIFCLPLEPHYGNFEHNHRNILIKCVRHPLDPSIPMLSNINFRLFNALECRSLSYQSEKQFFACQSQLFRSLPFHERHSNCVESRDIHVSRVYTVNWFPLRLSTHSARQKGKKSFWQFSIKQQHKQLWWVVRSHSRTFNLSS